jgi:4-amino-4-deoxy-L-arabinose transferase-like glycosyltransferase
VTKANTFLGGLLVSAAFLYLYRLGALAFTTDEIYHGIAARAILDTGKPVLPNGALYLKGVLFSYPGALFTYVFGSPEFGVRFTSALCHLLTGFVVYKLASALKDQRAGLLASFFWLFHPWTIELARWGRLYSLAALLLTTAIYFLLRFELRAQRASLWIACGVLLLATAVYPLCLWGGVVFAAYGLVRASRALPQRLRVRLGFAGVVCFAALVATVVVFGDTLIKHSPISLVAFTGYTGDPRGVKISRFIGYSPFYPSFFFTDLIVFALSLIALAVRAAMARVEPSRVPAIVVLLSITLGALVFVTFVHLQVGATRYLFPVFPAVVVGSVFLWVSLIDAHLPNQRSRAHAALYGLGIAGYLVAGSFVIPFKEHGDRYENPSFGPSPLRREYSNFKSAPAFVKQHAAATDMTITNKNQFFYFYAGREADYDLKLGRNLKGKRLSPYMTKTRMVNNCKRLGRLIKARKTATTWLALHTDKHEEKCLRKLGKQQRLELAFQDPNDERSKVYKVVASDP